MLGNKATAALSVAVDGMTISEVAKRLSLPGGTLKNRVYAARRGKSGEVGKNQKPLTGLKGSWHESSANWQKS